MRLICVLAVHMLAGCAIGDEPVAVRQDEIGISNSLTTNALTRNSLTTNSLTTNSLTTNSLTTNSLTTNALTRSALISATIDPESGKTQGELSRMFLKYAYSCAMPAGTSMTLEIDGVSYGTFEGALGLAPQWGADGGSCDKTCQRWVSACLLARTNYWGQPVDISLRGDHPALAVSAEEMAEYPLREGSFYGNVFGETVWVLDDFGLVEGPGRPLRACVAEGATDADMTHRLCGSGACGIANTGECATKCSATTGNGAYSPCTDTYRHPETKVTRSINFPETVTVYLRAPYAVCGNQVCDSTETMLACPADCLPGWSIEPTDDAHVTDVAASSAGTVMIGGGTFQPGDTAGSAFVASLADDGALRWRITPSQAASAVLTDAAGNIYVFGTAVNDVTIGASTARNAGAADVWVAKLTATGALVWLQSFGGRGSERAFAAALAPGGDLLVVGGFDSTFGAGKISVKSAGSYDAFMMRLSPAGALVSLQRFGGAGWDEATSVAVDASGRIAIGGFVNGTASVGGVTITGTGSSTFVASFTATGATSWVRAWVSGGSYSAQVAIAGGAVVAAGSFTGSTNVGGVALSSTGSSDVLVARFDAAGALQQLRALGGPEAETVDGVLLLPDGSVRVAGDFAGTIATAAGSLTAVAGRDVYLVGWDAAGQPVPSLRLGGSYEDSASSLTRAPDGDLLIGGGYASPRTGTLGLLGAGSRSTFLTRLDQP